MHKIYKNGIRVDHICEIWLSYCGKQYLNVVLIFLGRELKEQKHANHSFHGMCFGMLMLIQNDVKSLLLIKILVKGIERWFKGTGCSSRGIRFNSQYLHGG